MRRDIQRSVCMSCHKDLIDHLTKAGGVHAAFLGEQACAACHQPHAGRLPMLMRESFLFGPGDWEMPTGFVKAESGGSCMSACHEQRWYNNTYSLNFLRRRP